VQIQYQRLLETKSSITYLRKKINWTTILVVKSQDPVKNVTVLWLNMLLNGQCLRPIMIFIWKGARTYIIFVCLCSWVRAYISFDIYQFQWFTTLIVWILQYYVIICVVVILVKLILDHLVLNLVASHL
jgi:hypothetical protein